jgi:hypothetical protein
MMIEGFQAKEWFLKARLDYQMKWWIVMIIG